MALPSMRPQSPFNVYVATEAAVPGKDGASAALIAQFDQMLRGTYVFVQETGAIYAKPKAGAYTADGNRIVLVSSGSSGVDGVDGIFTNGSGVVSLGNVVAKDINPNNVVLADANDATKPAFGVVVDVIDATTCVVREFGECTPSPDGAFTVGANVYLSETPGTATTTAPTTAGVVVQKIGVAKSATEVILGATPTFSASFYAQNGTAAQPSWSFASDPGTGAYRFGASTIGFSLGGVIAALMGTDGFGYNGSDAVTAFDSNVLVLNHLSSGTTAAGFGTAVGFQVQKPNGDVATMGKVSGGMAVATPGAEQGRVDIVPAFAGTLASVGIRTRAPSAAALLVNGLEVLPVTDAAATSTGVSIAPYGTTTDVSLSLRPKGAGRTMLRDSGNTLTVLGVEQVGSGLLSGIVAWSSTATGTTIATLNATSGVVTFTDDAATTLTITNTLVTTSSLIFVNMQSATTNAVNIRRAVPTANTITIELSGAPGAANYAIAFLVMNPAT